MTPLWIHWIHSESQNFPKHHPHSSSHLTAHLPSTLFAGFSQCSGSSSVCLFYFFLKKKKTDKFFCDWIAQAENFLPLIVIFSVFLEKHSEKSGMATTIRSFFPLRFFDKKILCWGGKWAFFSNVFIIEAKKLLSMKMRSDFFLAPSSTLIQKKTH